MTNTDSKICAKINQRDIENLSNNYPNWFRKCEWFGIVVFFGIVVALFYKTIAVASTSWFLLLPAFAVAWVATDFFCGFVHWLADTWGSPDIPIVGAALIRPFREHHVDQLAMTHHDFIETNAAASLIGLPILIACLFVPIGPDKKLFTLLFFSIFFFTIFGLKTNQIHKWAHTEHPPVFIQWMQKYHLILNPKHHQIHHTAPFNQHYCITTGWLNTLLLRIRFFSTCEKFITKYTGALPRRDDVGEETAREILETYGKAS